MRGALLTIAACLLLVFAGCGDDDSSTTSTGGDETSATQPADETAAQATKPPKKKTKPTTVNLPDGGPPKELVTKDLEVGTGPAVKAGDVVSVNYIGVGLDTEEQFDASWDRGEPITFALGAGEVIPGWEQGIEGMKVGGRRELVIPPELAYGPEGRPPTIGPNETLIFVVDLEAVK